MTKTALEGIRVLDVSDESGYECGRFLADFGADVVKIEPPQGDLARGRAPFYGEEPDPNKSLFFWARNRNKRAITLDLDSAEGQEIFRKLAKDVDVVIDTKPVNWMRDRGIDFATLRAENPGLIMAGITPFGQQGPKSRHRGSDLTIMAASGFLDTLGDVDRAPLRLAVPQISQHASEAAAGSIMTALFHRETTGKGQYVDCSATQVQAACGSLTNWMTWHVNRLPVSRQGPFIETPNGGYKTNVFWECADGHVVFVFLPGGMGGGRMMEGMMEWMREEGFDPAPLDDFDWNTFDIGADYATQDFIDKYIEPVARFFKPKTREEIFAKALEKHIMLYPANDASTLIENVQLVARDFWWDVAHDDVGKEIKYPGAPMIMTETPMQPGTRAPKLSEHTDEVLAQAGLSADEIAALKSNGTV